MNPELQPETNLSTLPVEAGLTKAEINKFQKLSLEKQQEQKEKRVAKLLELQNKLEQAINEATKTGNLEEAKMLKKQIEKEIADLEQVVDSGLSIESLKIQHLSFLKDILGKPEGGFIPTLVKPKDQDYATLKDDVDITKFGEYTLNPDTQNLDFENIHESKIFIPNIPPIFVGKPFFEVFKYLVDTYSNTHYIPGVEYYKWLIQNPTKTPEVLKDKNLWFYFPGSLICTFIGSWDVPYVHWSGSNFYRGVGGLSYRWDSTYSVVFFEK
jgi:hypothetical protein